MARKRAGYELPLLLLGAFRSLIDELHEELAVLGFDDARPVHGFTLQAVGLDGASISELGRRLGVSKQAAAKTVASLERCGYVERVPNPADGRSLIVRRTDRGTDLLEASAHIFDRLRARLVQRLGANQVAELEDRLAVLIGDHPVPLGDLPGWLR